MTAKRFSKKTDYSNYKGLNFYKRCRRSKPKREERFYLKLSEIGLAVPDNINIVESRNTVGMLSSAIIEMDMLNAVDLRYFFIEEKWQKLANKRVNRMAIIKAVAEQLKLMNEHDFFHHNLNFRNVLIETDKLPQTTVYFIDCTAGKKHRFKLFNRELYMKTKELAFLYKYARHHLSVREMIYFMHVYCDCKKLSSDERDLIQSIIKYTARKWD